MISVQRSTAVLLNNNIAYTDTIVRGITPDEPSNEGETRPALGSRCKHSSTSLYICRRVNKGPASVIRAS